MSTYEITIFYSAEDGVYIAEILDLEYCSAFGQTPAEALAEVERVRCVDCRGTRGGASDTGPTRARPLLNCADSEGDGVRRAV